MKDEVITVPYDQLSLRLALLSLESKLNDEKMYRIKDKIEEIVPKGKLDQNERIAEYNGINLETLINSPNYSTLKKEYIANMLNKAVDIIMEEDFTHKESWAILALSMGMIVDP